MNVRHDLYLFMSALQRLGVHGAVSIVVRIPQDRHSKQLIAGGAVHQVC